MKIFNFNLAMSTGINVFKKVGIVGRLDSAEVLKSVEQIVTFLQTKDIEITLEESIAEHFLAKNLSTFNVQNSGNINDLVIVVGGDGSFLSTSRKLINSSAKVIGVNRGRLGFLTDINPNKLEEYLEPMLNNDFVQEERFFLQAKVLRNKQIIAENIALNDILLHSEQSSSMSAVNLFINNQFVYHQKADGLLVSTPTGSTAYALSAGGPILQPDLNAVLIIPMYPHALSSRPIVINGDSIIRIEVAGESVELLSFDGHNHIKCEPLDEIIIHRTNETIKILHPTDYNFYRACRTKLGWNLALREGDKEIYKKLGELA